MKDNITRMKDMRFGPYGLLSKRKNILLSAILIVLTLVIDPYIILIDAGIQASVPARSWDDHDDGPGSVHTVPFSGSELNGLSVFPGPVLELAWNTGDLDHHLQQMRSASNVKVFPSSIEHDYIRSFGGKGGEEMSSAVRTSDGGYAIVGVTNTYPLGQSNYPNLWLLRLDIEGKELWNRSFGDEGLEYGYDIVELDNGDLILAGTKRPVDKDDTDIWLIGTDSSGNERWNEVIDLGGEEKVSGLTATMDGGYVTCGYIMDPLLASKDLILVKSGPSGKKEWHNVFGGDGDEEGSDVIETATGDLVTLGYIDTDLNGIDQVLLYRTNSTGSELWQKAYGSLNVWESGSCLEELENGDLIASGISMTMPGVGLDLVMMRTSKEGTQRWFRTYGGGGNDRGAGLLIDEMGITMTGFSNSYGSGGDNVLLIRTDLSGNQLWSRYYEGPQQDYGIDSFPSKYGHFVLGTSLSFGPGPSGVVLLNLSEAFTAASGTYISDDLLYHMLVGELQEVQYLTDIPSGTRVSIMFSTDLIKWSDGMGRPNRSVELYSGGGKVSLPYFSDVNIRFYYSLTFECENGTFSSFMGMTLYYNTRSPSGTLLSPVYRGGPDVEWGELRIKVANPDESSTIIQVRSGKDPTSILSNEFVGPDGDNVSSYSDHDRLWSGHAGDSYVQFFVYMTNIDPGISFYNPSSTPTLYYINLTFDNPNELVDGSVSATTGDIDTLFNFTVTYTDLDHDRPDDVFLNLDGRNLSMSRSGPLNGYMGDSIDLFFETNLSMGEHTYRFFSSTYGRTFSTDTGTISVSHGPLASIEVFPKDLVISADEEVQFFARGFDRMGNELEIGPAWDLVGSGILDEYGYFSPDKVGNCTIRASWGGVSGSTNITVRQGALHWIKVTLPSQTINADMVVRFEANGFDRKENPVNIAPVWKVTGGGTISQNGTFDAVKAGFWRVYANVTDVSGIASFEVVPGKMSVIMVEPHQVTLNISDEVKFMAMGLDSDGNPLDLSPVWSVSGGGTISPDGLFVASSPGIWTVFCDSSGISGTASITVVPPPDGGDDDTDDDDDDDDDAGDEDDSNVVLILAVVLVVAVLLLIIGGASFVLLKRRDGKATGSVTAPAGEGAPGTADSGTDASLGAEGTSPDGPVPDGGASGPEDAGQTPPIESEVKYSGTAPQMGTGLPTEGPSENGSGPETIV